MARLRLYRAPECAVCRTMRAIQRDACDEIEIRHDGEACKVPVCAECLEAAHRVGTWRTATTADEAHALEETHKAYCYACDWSIETSSPALAEAAATRHTMETRHRVAVIGGDESEE